MHPTGLAQHGIHRAVRIGPVVQDRGTDALGLVEAVEGLCKRVVVASPTDPIEDWMPSLGRDARWNRKLVN